MSTDHLFQPHCSQSLLP